MSEAPRKTRHIGQLLLKVVGALIATLSGLCTGRILIQPGGDQYGIKTLSLIIGGVPFAIGLLLYWLGSRGEKK